MHFPLSLPLLALLSLTAAQCQLNLTGLPACGVACRTKNLNNTLCDPNDVPCLCADYSFFLDVYSCEAATCSANDTLTAVNWARVGCGLPPVSSLKRSKRSRNLWE